MTVRVRIILSGQNTAYLMERGLGMLDRIKFIGNNYRSFRIGFEIPEDIVKISVYISMEGSGPMLTASSPLKTGRLCSGRTLLDRYYPCQQRHRCVTPLSAGSYGIDLTDVMAFGVKRIITTYPCWISWDVYGWCGGAFRKNTRIARRARRHLREITKRILLSHVRMMRFRRYSATSLLPSVSW